MIRLEGGGCNFVLGLFVFKRMLQKKVGASWVKDSEKLLEAFCDYIVVRGSDVDPSLLSKMEVFIKKKNV